MSRHFDRQRDALPARYTGGFRIQEIRAREVEREAARRWPLLAAVDDHLWSRHVRRNAFDRTTGHMGTEPEDAPRPRSGTVFAMGGNPWGNRR
jgi:hypothetical protein